MYKEENESDKEIVSDRILRMADKIISDTYFTKKDTLYKQYQKELLEQRRIKIKAIKDKKR